MLYIINETTFNGYSVYNLDLLHIIAILLGILVIISKNPIVSVLFLIGLFLSISGYLILTGLNFMGLAYLLVYIGAVSILFLFILMLINVRISELLIDSINSIPLAILLGSFFNYFVKNILPHMEMTNSLFYGFIIKNRLTKVTSVSWDGYLAESSHITSIGNILYGNYSIWLILTSIILLLAMIGCIVITLKEKTSNYSHTEVKYPLAPILPLESSFFIGLKLFIFKLRYACAIILSKDYVIYLKKKLFSRKSFLIMLSSIAIANIVRYYAIKYGISTPLHDHPVLFSSATGITSFLSMSVKITIEKIFTLFGENELPLVVGDPPVLPKNNDSNILKMVQGNKDAFATSPSKSYVGTALSQDKVEAIPEVNFDLNKIDNLLDQLKTTISSLATDVNSSKLERINDIEKDIQNQIQSLQELGNEAQKLHAPVYMNLTSTFFSLKDFKEFSDIGPIVKEILEVMSKDNKAPTRELLESNPEMFWREKIKYANRVQDNINTQCNLIKNYVKYNGVLTSQDKKDFLTAIKKVNKNASIVAEADKILFRKQVENSVILKELRK